MHLHTYNFALLAEIGMRIHIRIRIRGLHVAATAANGDGDAAVQFTVLWMRRRLRNPKLDGSLGLDWIGMGQSGSRTVLGGQ